MPKSKENSIDKVFKTYLSIYKNNFQSDSLPKIQSTRRSSSKKTYQEDYSADFVANSTMIALNNITEKNFPAGDVFARYDDPIMICRQITSEIHTPEIMLLKLILSQM